MEVNNEDAAFKRLYTATGCHTQIELAKILEIRQSSISDAKRRNSIPSEWLWKLMEKKRINPYWILHGQGAMFLEPVDDSEGKPHVVRIIEVRPPEKCSSQDLINELVRRALST